MKLDGFQQRLQVWEKVYYADNYSSFILGTQIPLTFMILLSNNLSELRLCVNHCEGNTKAAVLS
jgi:hypothetical protein